MLQGFSGILLNLRTATWRTCVFVHVNDPESPGNLTLLVEWKSGVHLGGNPSGNDFEDLTSELHEHLVNGLADGVLVITQGLTPGNSPENILHF